MQLKFPIVATGIMVPHGACRKESSGAPRGPLRPTLRPAGPLRELTDKPMKIIRHRAPGRRDYARADSCPAARDLSLDAF